MVIRISQDVISTSSPGFFRTNGSNENDTPCGSDDPIPRGKEASVLEAIAIDGLGDIRHGLPAASSIRALGEVHLDGEL